MSDYDIMRNYANQRRKFINELQKSFDNVKELSKNNILTDNVLITFYYFINNDNFLKLEYTSNASSNKMQASFDAYKILDIASRIIDIRNLNINNLNLTRIPELLSMTPSLRSVIALENNFDTTLLLENQSLENYLFSVNKKNELTSLLKEEKELLNFLRDKDIEIYKFKYTSGDCNYLNSQLMNLNLYLDENIESVIIKINESNYDPITITYTKNDFCVNSLWITSEPKFEQTQELINRTQYYTDALAKIFKHVSFLCLNHELPKTLEFKELKKAKIITVGENVDLFYKCRQLEKLTLVSNTNVFPESIKYLKKLNYLKIDCDNIQEIPEWIGELSELETLILNNEHNNTYFELPNSIKNLNKLRKFDCQTNINELPEWIGELTELEKLSVMVNIKKNKLPESISNLKKLKSLLIPCDLTTLPEFINADNFKIIDNDYINENLKEIQGFTIINSHLAIKPDKYGNNPDDFIDLPNIENAIKFIELAKELIKNENPKEESENDSNQDNTYIKREKKKTYPEPFVSEYDLFGNW